MFLLLIPGTSSSQTSAPLSRWALKQRWLIPWQLPRRSGTILSGLWVWATWVVGFCGSWPQPGKVLQYGRQSSPPPPQDLQPGRLWRPARKKPPQMRWSGGLVMFSVIVNVTMPMKKSHHIHIFLWLEGQRHNPSPLLTSASSFFSASVIFTTIIKKINLWGSFPLPATFQSPWSAFGCPRHQGWFLMFVIICMMVLVIMMMMEMLVAPC